MLTLDLQILGQRHKDLKNGLTVPPKLTLANLLDLMTKPRWGLRMLGAKRTVFGNIVGHVKGVGDIVSLSAVDGAAVRPDARLERRRVGQEALGRQADPQGHPGRRGREDRAVASGADAIVVSNHGGRQLDGALSSIRGAAGDRRRGRRRSIEVWMDGGIRSGQDVLKALALGAQGTLIGRAFLYGLGAMGEAGVTHGARDHPQGARPDDGALRRAHHRRDRAEARPQSVLTRGRAGARPPPATHPMIVVRA